MVKNVSTLQLTHHPTNAIEVDVTSKTQLDAYKQLGVPELWRYDNGNLQIDIYQNGEYAKSDVSPTFPKLPILEIIPRFVEQSRVEGRSSALKGFKKWIQDNITF